MTAGPITAADFARAAKILDSADQVCLACHVRPDADALGSMLALALALELPARLGRASVVASFGDTPFAVPAILRFLPGTGAADAARAGAGRDRRSWSRWTPASMRPARPAGGQRGRGRRADRAGPSRVEHRIRHRQPGRSRSAAATAVLVYRLISGAGHRADPRHRDRPVRGPGHRHRLVQVRQPPRRRCTSWRPAARAPASTPARSPATCTTPPRSATSGCSPPRSNRAQLDPAACGGLGLVWTTVTRADREAAALPLDAAESVIDEVRKTGEAEVAVVLKETDDATWEVSVRSKEIVDVGAACTAAGRGRPRPGCRFLRFRQPGRGRPRPGERSWLVA